MKKKTLLIVIISIIIVLLIAGGVFAYLFLATDMFKTDKELFAKYTTSMISDKANQEAITNLENYFTKKQTMAYSNEGDFSAYVGNLEDNTDESIKTIIDAINIANNTNITFNGKIDNTNKQVEENIQINYTDTVNLPFTYKQDGDIYGIKMDSITPNYVAIENNNLKELFQKLGATDVSQIPDRIEPQEIESVKFTDEEKAHLLSAYVQPIFNGISEEKFSKIENADGSINYNLTLTNQEVKDILVQTLQILSTDTMMINKINNIIGEVYQDETMNISSEDIQELINNLNETSADGSNITISVTNKNGSTNKISISSENTVLEFTKNQTKSNVSYNLAINGTDENNISVQISYEGLDTNTISENYSIAINITGEMAGSTNLEYSFNNTVTFDNSITIDAMPQESTAVLNNYPVEQVQPFIEQLGIAIEQLNSNQMTQIGYPTDMVNPMVMWFTAPSIIRMYSNINSSIDNNVNDLNNVEIQTNNARFETYKGVISGSQVKVLCDKVKTNNLDVTLEKINIKLGETASATSFVMNANDTDSIKNSIQPEKTYNVTLSYDVTTGYVCEIGIVEIN